jgi:RNA polymerase sigma-70 factor (ECF subfamily)
MDAGEVVPAVCDLEKYRLYLLFVAERVLDRRLWAKVDPSDLVQQTLVAATNHLAQVDQPPSDVIAWLRTILGNLLINIRRHYFGQKRDVRRELSIEESLSRSSACLIDILEASGSSPSSALHREELCLAVAAAVMDLSPNQREAIILRYWDRLGVAEIAAKMGTTVEAVTGLLQRGLRGREYAPSE